MNPFIWTQDNVLSSEFCDQIIKKFDADGRSSQGLTSGGYKPDVKSSLDLTISTLNDWKYEDSIFFNKLNQYVDSYRIHLEGRIPGARIFESDDIKDSGYQIQKTAPGEGYTWHNDSHIGDGYTRALTYIWYLNDVPKGGETEFYDGTLIKPACGRMAIFPATWTFVHRGNTPTINKYIVAGWLSYRYPNSIE